MTYNGRIFSKCFLEPCLKIYFPKIFAPPIFETKIFFCLPNIYDKSTPLRSTRSSSILTLLRPSVTSSLKFSNRSIAVAVPPFWNKLPPALRQISESSYELTQTSPLKVSPLLFHSKLKTLLFGKSYPDLSSSSYLPPRLNSKHHPP